MSVHVSSWAWKQVVGDAAAKLVLVKLADSANDEGVCWPSQRFLCDETELPKRTLQKKIAYLRDRGLITTHRRWRQSMVYDINVPKGAPAAPMTKRRSKAHQ